MSSESMQAIPEILLCCDLDRTLLPNGQAPESAAARPLLRRLAKQAQLQLVYVSGRHKALIREAIEHYELPLPSFAIGDVGTSIYEIHPEQWILSRDWDREIARDWKGRPREYLAGLLSDIAPLSLQEPEKQNRRKLSYYADPTTDSVNLIRRVRKRLAAEDLQVSVIWSIDEQDHVGLLDILPQRATKLHAVRFLRRRASIPVDRIVYAGDSGNDMAVLTSEIQSVLVQNASEAVRSEARRKSAERGNADRLYLAKGGLLGMNGNYAAGVLEGLVHFFPQAGAWLQAPA